MLTPSVLVKDFYFWNLTDSLDCVSLGAWKSTQQPCVVPWFMRYCHLKYETSIYDLMTFAWRVSLVTWRHLPDFYRLVSAWTGLHLSFYLHRNTGFYAQLFFRSWCVYSLWQACGKLLGESWKKGKLHVLCGVCRDTVHYYQAAVKASI